MIPISQRDEGATPARTGYSKYFRIEALASSIPKTPAERAHCPGWCVFCHHHARHADMRTAHLASGYRGARPVFLFRFTVGLHFAHIQALPMATSQSRHKCAGLVHGQSFWVFPADFSGPSAEAKMPVRPDAPMACKQRIVIGCWPLRMQIRPLILAQPVRHS